MEIVDGGGVTSAHGFEAGTASSGLRTKTRRPDIALLYSQEPCSAAALFTQNQVAAAPVLLDRETITANRARMRAVVANAGNANACTGAPGLWAARQMQKNAAFALGCDEDQILVLSTGVIGVQLPMSKVNVGIDTAAKHLSPGNGRAAAEAIMTTDTFAKQIAVRLRFSDGHVVIGGMAKGAGMIHPNMATMLALITSDAQVEPSRLQDILKQAADRSFNRITVDGDTSTNDTVLLLANGSSGVQIGDAERQTLFQEALNYVCEKLAQMIVRDGEGATKFVTITVRGAPGNEAAHIVANAIATSPLVKTALAGSDANWGRILAAAGRAGVPFEQSKVALRVGKSGSHRLQLVENGTPSEYAESEASAIFEQDEIEIELDLGVGDGASKMWTCDLGHDYVSINADYRT
ncbi:MAG TPA: bifunctional glutamate N-acetyltransferase/amino-acid acetyltransferase ArgJ [Candidatus Binatia bacterium]|nr:bifunctional glutamate N-acetyltransferase/amino-acid acetyltransferase ArgJ [Candidatus Binatia bacterium]